MKREVNAIWNGNGSEGIGYLSAKSGAIDKMPYTLSNQGLRTKTENLEPTPEELIASALAGCFNMKLAFVLNEENFEPEKLETNAKLLFEDGVVTNIHLDLKRISSKNSRK